jgi:hypothetical protein
MAWRLLTLMMIAALHRPLFPWLDRSHIRRLRRSAGETHWSQSGWV